VNINHIARAFCVLSFCAATATAQTPQPTSPRDARDEFYFMTIANKAQIVMLEEERLIPRPEAQRIAAGIRTIAAEQAQPGAGRSGDYLRFETEMVKRVGLEASKLHMGRSRNDLGAAVNRMMIRDKMLEALDALADARESLLNLSAKHVNTIYPAYTQHVQAQPISLAHYLLALSSALERDAQRATESYRRLNHSTLGAGALGTSGFPLNRLRLMELAGFDGLLENSYDAICVSEADSKIEVASAFAISSLAIGRFAQDLANQYGDPVPGLYFSDEMTGRSSIMPQKRNPGAIESLRRLATSVLAESQKSLLMAHNTNFGEVSDVRYALKDQVLTVGDETARMYRALKTVLDGLQVNPARTLEKVNSDFSTMTELADALLREAGVPFRQGYNFASAVTTYGRQNGKTPSQITYPEYQRIYKEVNGAVFPLEADAMQQVVDPRRVVANRRGRGGPQPAEVERMLSEHRTRLAASRAWVGAERQKMADAETKLNGVFNVIAGQ
jgi:argininosuccinate lyase